MSIRFGSDFVRMWSRYLSNNVWRNIRLPVSAFATVARRSFNGKLTTLRTGILCYYYWLKSLPGVSPFIIDKYLDHMLVKFEQNRMLRKIQNFSAFWQKWLTIFEKGLTLFWKMFLWQKQLFDSNVLTERLSSFIVPNIMVFRHV